MSKTKSLSHSEVRKARYRFNFQCSVNHEIYLHLITSDYTLQSNNNKAVK